MADRVVAAVEGQGDPAPRALPEPAVAREWLEAMLLIRHFEERAGEMYAKAKIGGVLHPPIGGEATILGAARAERDGRQPPFSPPSPRHPRPPRGSPDSRLVGALL